MQPNNQPVYPDNNVPPAYNAQQPMMQQQQPMMVQQQQPMMVQPQQQVVYTGQPQQQVVYTGQPQVMYTGQPMVMEQPVVYPVQTTIVQTTRSPYEDDMIFSFLIFGLGFLCCCIWLAGFRYIKSPNASARAAAIGSIACYFISIIIVIIIIIVESIAASAAASDYCTYNNY